MVQPQAPASVRRCDCAVTLRIVVAIERTPCLGDIRRRMR
jgi:hypothetical protein